MADDSGLSIKILSNQPGIYSSRWAFKDNYLNAFSLIKSKIKEKGQSIQGQSASFNCCLALVYNPNRKYIFDGVLEGHLTFPPRGKEGFGYDPIFIPHNSKKTLAEITNSEKNKISHRKLALDKLKEFLFEK